MVLVPCRVQVLHEYIDMMEFKGLPLDEAIRHFLSGFRLPGEAQKIDRMMEKFAERFCSANGEVPLHVAVLSPNMGQAAWFFGES